MAGDDTRLREAGAAPPDWRGLLDLLEDRTGKMYDDLWRAWVVRPEEAHLLDLRRTARDRYDALVKRAGDVAPAARSSATRCGPGSSTRRRRCSTAPRGRSTIATP